MLAVSVARAGDLFGLLFRPGRLPSAHCIFRRWPVASRPVLRDAIGEAAALFTGVWQW